MQTMTNQADTERSLAIPRKEWEVEFGRDDPVVTVSLDEKRSWKVSVAELSTLEGLAELKQTMPGVIDLYLANRQRAEDLLGIIGYSATSLINAAKACMSIGDYANAERYYRNAVDLDPKFVSAQIELARVRLYRGDREEAYFIIDRFLDHEIYGQDAHILAAQAAYGVREFTEARRLLEEGISVWRNNPWLHLNLGLAIVSDIPANIQSAAHHFRRALRLEPSIGDAYHGMALCYVFQGLEAGPATFTRLLRKAIRFFNIGLSVGGISAEGVRNLARAYQCLDQHQDVVDLLEPYLRQARHDMVARFILSVSLSESKMPLESKSHLLTLLDVQGVKELDQRDHPDIVRLADRDRVPVAGIYNNLGVTFAQTSDPTNAGAYYKQAADTSTSPEADSLARQNMIINLILRERIDDAKLLLKSSLELYPDNERIKLTESFVLEIDGEQDRAMAILTELAESNPEFVEVYVNLAHLQGEWLGNYTLARNTIKTAIGLFPREKFLKNVMAYFSLKSGNIAYARRIMASPDWPADLPQSRATEGLACLISGDLHQGITLYNRAGLMAQEGELKKLVEQKKRLEVGHFYMRNGENRKAIKEFKRAKAIKTLERLYGWQASEILRKLSTE